jgi:hypothetical protein
MPAQEANLEWAVCPPRAASELTWPCSFCMTTSSRPAGGFALMIVEDALDRFVVKKLEGRVRSPIVRATPRLIFNPSRSTANVAALRAPWFRQDRPLRQPPVLAPVQ